MNSKVLGVIMGVSGAVLVVAGYYVSGRWTFALGVFPLIIGIWLLVRITVPLLKEDENDSTEQLSNKSCAEEETP